MAWLTRLAAGIARRKHELLYFRVTELQVWYPLSSEYEHVYPLRTLFLPTQELTIIVLHAEKWKNMVIIFTYVIIG